MLRFFLHINSKCVTMRAPPERQLSRGRHFKQNEKRDKDTESSDCPGGSGGNTEHYLLDQGAANVIKDEALPGFLPGRVAFFSFDNDLTERGECARICVSGVAPCILFEIIRPAGESLPGVFF